MYWEYIFLELKFGLTLKISQFNSSHYQNKKNYISMSIDVKKKLIVLTPIHDNKDNP